MSKGTDMCVRSGCGQKDMCARYAKSIRANHKYKAFDGTTCFKPKRNRSKGTVKNYVDTSKFPPYLNVGSGM